MTPSFGAFYLPVDLVRMGCPDGVEQAAQAGKLALEY